VVVEDAEHWFTDEYIKWNAGDRIEIYCQAGGQGGRDWLGTYDIAQQYMMGPNTSGGSWATWALGETIGQDVGLEYAVSVDGDRIIHEAGVPMFENYGGFAGGETILAGLQAGSVVGFDVVASSRWADDAFGMLSDNLMTGKAGNAEQFSTHVLVTYLPITTDAVGIVDLDNDGEVDWSDLVLLAENWLWAKE
jgi:hypothetical protein